NLRDPVRAAGRPRLAHRHRVDEAAHQQPRHAARRDVSRQRRAPRCGRNARPDLRGRNAHEQHRGSRAHARDRTAREHAAVTPRARIIGGTLGAAVAIAAPMGAYFEGVFPVGYADPVGIATDCIGETEGARVGVQRHTYAECLARYDARLAGRWEALSTSCIHHDVTVHEAAAIVSWADNVGIYAACTSTLVRMLNAGARAAT